jgi:hypothetical protein
LQILKIFQKLMIKFFDKFLLKFIIIYIQLLSFESLGNFCDKIINKILTKQTLLELNDKKIITKFLSFFFKYLNKD